MKSQPFSGGKVIMPRAPLARFLSKHPKVAPTLNLLYDFCVYQASYDNDLGKFRTTIQELRRSIHITERQTRYALSILCDMKLLQFQSISSENRRVGIEITILGYEENHRTFQVSDQVSDQVLDQSDQIPTGYDIPVSDQVSDQVSDVFKQGFKQGVSNNASFKTIKDEEKEKDKGASVSHETVEEQTDLNLTTFEPAFLLGESEASLNIDKYHNLIAWFYDRCLEFGWRESLPPVGTQLRQAKILIDYEREGFKTWAIEKMVHWHVERCRRRGHPLSSFDFFDASKAKYLTPIQEAMMALWHERQQKYQEPPDQVDPDGLMRLAKMYEKIAPSKSDVIARRNARFIEQVQRDRHEQNSRKAILERLDSPDMTIPTVDELKPMGRPPDEQT